MITQRIEFNKTTIFLRPGQDENKVREKYKAVFARKAGDLFLDNNLKPPIDIEDETAKAELDWRQGVQIAFLFFKKDLTTAQISDALNVSVELVNSFISDEHYAHQQMKRLAEKEKETPESLGETLQRLSK